MKFAIFVVLAILGAANASLNDDFQDIKALIPLDEIKAITVEYATNDEEFQRVLAYFQSEDFQAIISAIYNTAEWLEFVSYLDEQGVQMTELIESIYGLLGIPRTFDVPSPRVTQRSFHGWLDAVIALIPVDDLIAIIKEKVETSSYFQAFWAHLQSENFQNVAASLSATPEWQTLLQKGRDHGAPVDVWINLIKNLFGWN